MEEAMASGRGGERRRVPWVQYRQQQEFLPPDEILGGYIFLCDDTTMTESLDRQLFGLPDFYRDSVRTIRPGTPLFLFNCSTRLLYGNFEATSFGNYNIDPTAWQENNGAGSPPRSRFPAQCRFPLEEVIFRPLSHHYAPLRFRLPMTVTQDFDIIWRIFWVLLGCALLLESGMAGYYWIPTFQRRLYRSL